MGEDGKILHGVIKNRGEILNNQEIKFVLSRIVNEYINHNLDNKLAVEELITKLNPEEIYDIEDDNEIVECYFAIKHLCEDGYETTFAEMKYFDECFNEKCKFSGEEKNNFILKFNKGYINHRKESYHGELFKKTKG